MNQLEGTFPEPGLMRQEASVSIASVLARIEIPSIEYVKDIYYFE